MADYKQMYLTLLDATEKAINELVSAQRACEEIYIHSTAEEETAEKAKELALEHKLHAQEDPVYAATQYPIDMTRQALYEEARKHLV